MARPIEGQEFKLPPLGFSPRATSKFLGAVAKLLAERKIGSEVAKSLQALATANTSAYKAHREDTDVPKMREMLEEMRALDAKAEGRALEVQQGRRSSH